jgi:hypothetical protein
MAPENKCRLEPLFKVGDRVKVNSLMELSLNGKVGTVESIYKRDDTIPARYMYEYGIKFDIKLPYMKGDYMGGINQDYLSYAD